MAAPSVTASIRRSAFRQVLGPVAWGTGATLVLAILIVEPRRSGATVLDQHGSCRYDPLYWGAVFPLGMYAVSTFRLAHAIDALYLLIIPTIFLYIAMSAWALVMVGLIRQLVRR